MKSPSVTAILALGLTMMAPTHAPAQNLLVNGDFDSPTSAAAPTAWQSWSYAKLPEDAWVNHAKDGNGFDGSYYLQVGSKENGTSGAGVYQIVPAAPGFIYHLSVASGTQAWWWPRAEMRLSFLDTASNSLSESVSDLTEKITRYDQPLPWAIHDLSVISPIGTAYVKIEFASQSGTGTVYFDHAVLTNVASDLPLSPYAIEMLPASSPYGEAMGIKNIPYLAHPTARQNFDLYLPLHKGQRPFPLIVWIHGGAWMMGLKDWDNVKYLVRDGYAIASVDYRFTTDAPFPAQIQDCNAALDFILAHATNYGIDPKNFIVGGGSAGGHLSLLLGLARTETDFGADPSLKPRAVLDFFGPADFNRAADDLTKIHSQKGLDLLKDAGTRLLGSPVEQAPDKAKAASPITYVSPNAPPVLILQGAKDDLVPPDQSIRLEAALRRAGAKTELIMINEAGHDGPLFSTPDIAAKVIAFLNQLPPALN
jgi:acetyl esterase/lipase